MAALSRAWQAAIRHITDSTASTAAEPSAGRHSGSVQGRSVALAALRAVAGRLYRRCRQVDGLWRDTRCEHGMARVEVERARAMLRRSERRSLLLLVRQLNHEQRQEFRVFGYFHVTGGCSGDRYRIRAETTANIDVLHTSGRAKYRLCAGPVGVPVYAMMAGQLLHLQDPASERQFLRRANIHPVYPTLSGNIP